MRICYKEMWICMNISTSLFNISTNSVINMIISTSFFIISTPLKMWIYYKTCGYVYIRLSSVSLLSLSLSSLSPVSLLSLSCPLLISSKVIATVSHFRLVILKLKIRHQHQKHNELFILDSILSSFFGILLL